MDQDVINLAKAIRDRESRGNFGAVGDAGTSKGGYQWQPNTWKEHSKKILGNENAEMTPDNQNAVAYGMIKTWKDQGLNPAQIAAKWNSGQSTGWENKIGTTTINGQKIKYNVPQYVKEVTDTYQRYKMENQVIKAPEKTAGEIKDIASAEKYGAMFPSKSEGTAAGEAIRTVANIPKSAFGFVKGAIDIVNPVSTANKIKEIISGTKEFAQEKGGMGKAIWDIIKATPETAYEVLVPEVARKVISGDLEEAQRAIVNDPVGQILPFIIAAKGGAKVADTAATKSAMAKYVREPFTQKTIPKPTTKYSEAVDTAISKTAGAVTEPVKSAFGMAVKARDFVTSQATGLSPETIRTVKEYPGAFTKKSMATVDRASIGRQVQSELGKLAEEKSVTGKEYQPVRESGKIVNVDPTFWESTFKETTGLEIKKGQLTPTTTSKIRDAGDVRALQKVYEFWKPKFKSGKMTADEYLNMREDLAKASKFEKDIGKRKDVEILAGQIRAKLNQAYRPQIEGLSKLDESMSSQIKEYKELSKGLVDKDGIITDAGLKKVANLSKDKPRLAEQLEKIVPGITQQVKVLQAIVDIERASGIKVGTYSRAALTGGAFLGGGVISGIITAVLTSPEVAVPLLRRYGLIKNATAVKAVTNALRESAGFVNKLPETMPGYLQKDTKEIPMGMSIKDVSKAPSVKWLEKNADYETSFRVAKDAFNNGYEVVPVKELMGELEASKPIRNIGEFETLPEHEGFYVYKNIEKPSSFSPKGKGVVAPEKTTSPLIQEAKKYKSAKEFVNSIWSKKGFPKNEYDAFNRKYNPKSNEEVKFGLTDIWKKANEKSNFGR